MVDGLLFIIAMDSRSTRPSREVIGTHHLPNTRYCTRGAAERRCTLSPALQAFQYRIFSGGPFLLLTTSREVFGTKVAAK